MNNERPLSRRMATLLTELESGNLSHLEVFYRVVENDGTPLVEMIDGDDEHVLVTFIFQSDEETENVVIVPGLASGFQPAKNRMARVKGTNLWYRTYRVRRDLRTTYYFSPDDPLVNVYEMSRDEERAYMAERSRSWRADPLNPRQFEMNSALPPMSVIELPWAPAQPHVAVRADTPCGDVIHHEIEYEVNESTVEARSIWVYTPPSYTNQGPCYALLVLFDGSSYLKLGIPTLLDNLIHGGLIRPIVCVMIGQIDREFELACNSEFIDFVAKELLPIGIRAHYNVTDDPAMTIIAGASYGGLAAVFAALRHPTIFGCALSQSGSFWWSPEGSSEHEWLAREIVEMSLAPLRFFLDVGLLEAGPSPGNGPSQLVVNRHMRDMLRAKGCVVSYREYNGGHDYICWRGTFVEGLLSLANHQSR